MSLFHRFASSFALASFFCAGSARAQPVPAGDAPGASATSAPAAAPAAEPYTSPPNDSLEKAGGDHREVAGHRFITPIREGYTAFTNSSILFEQGFGAYLSNTQFKVPLIGRVEPTLFQYHQLFGAQIAIANRVSIDLRATGTADIGSNVPNILAFGAIGDVEAGGTPKVRLFTLRKVGLTMSVGLNVSFQHDVQFSPLDVATALAKGKNPAGGIKQQNDYVLSPLLMIAEGYGPFGVQLTAFPRLANGDAQDTRFVLDVHLAFDIGRLTRYVPVAIAFEYEPTFLLSDQANDPASTFHGIAAGVYFTGRRDLDLGAAFTFDSLPLENANEFSGRMTIQYYF